eukprot:391820-Rhodomonas_salina.1
MVAWQVFGRAFAALETQGRTKRVQNAAWAILYNSKEYCSGELFLFPSIKPQANFRSKLLQKVKSASILVGR